MKVGGKTERLNSHKYKLPLIDKEGREIYFEVYGIGKITNEIQSIDIGNVTKLFKNISREEITRPTGEIDVLIGYQYAAYHPEKEHDSDHLLLLKNRFGRCIGGSHPMIQRATQCSLLIENTFVHHVTGITIANFYGIENLGIECKPRCGGCKCGKCAIGTKNYTLQEERELKLIEDNLEYDKKNKRWVAGYPWVKDPNKLPNNRKVALARLISTEKRLARNPEHAVIYDQQIQDMIERNIARKLKHDELKAYTGPYHYICHHEVLKPESKTMPVRIVFNGSANYMGHILNDYWAKGLHLLKSI